MPVLIYGLNHVTATLDMRGRLAFGGDELSEALRALQTEVPALSEAAILSTCNRTEIHGYSQAATTKPILDWLAQRKDVPLRDLQNATYDHSGQTAVAHAMRVAAGLDSQILGEPQIQGQFKVAYQTARKVGTMGTELTLLEDFTLQTAKRIRTETQIGTQPVSVAYAAITMAKQIFADFKRAKTLLIGAGSNIRLIARYLQDEGAEEFTVANRTLSNAESLAESLNGTAITLGKIANLIHKFDIVVSSTGSPEAIVTAAMLVQASKQRRHKAMFIADIAVPRDVEAAAAEIPDVYLYTVDDLSKIISQSLVKRRELTGETERLVAEGVECYVQKRRIQVASSLLSNYRAQVDLVRRANLESAIKRLHAGDEASAVIAKLAHELTNQLAHKPTIAIRQATGLGNEELLNFLKDIYELET